MLGLVNQVTVAPQLCAAAGAAPAASASDSRAAAAPLASKDEPFVLIKKPPRSKAGLPSRDIAAGMPAEMTSGSNQEIRLFSAV
jgi:hypothetical protein